MNWKHLMSGICAVASFPGALHAAACATLTPSPASMVVSGWDPIGGAAQDLSLNLSLQRVSSSAKSVRLILVDAETAALPLRIAGSNGPRYEITDTATGSLIAYPMSTSVDSTNAPVRAFPNGANASINIAARLHVFANTSPIEDFIGGNSYYPAFLVHGAMP